MKHLTEFANRNNYYVFFGLLILVAISANLDKGWGTVLTWIPLIALACFFIFAFTQSLGEPTEVPPLHNIAAEKEAGKENFSRLLLMLRAGYFFMLLTLGICIVPFVAPNVMFKHLTSGEQHNGPFQIVIGCAEDPEVRVAISCDNTSFSPQWLVSLGASRSGTPFWPGRTDTITALEDQLEEIQTATRNIVALNGQNSGPAVLKRGVAELQTAIGAFDTGVSKLKGEAEQANALHTAFLGTQTSVTRFSEAANNSLSDLKQATRNADLLEVARKFELNIDAVLTEVETFSTQVREDKKVAYLKGGLVVPLYVVVLSLLGGSISMTRKLPEIQLRAAPGYQNFYASQVKAGLGDRLRTPIQAVQARDFLLFQILQVVTAPFLAMVAYASIEPESVASAVAVGFGAGFASEPLLLRLRNAIDNLAGLDPQAQAENARKGLEAKTDVPGPPDPDEAAATAVNVARQSTTNSTND